MRFLLSIFAAAALSAAFAFAGCSSKSETSSGEPCTGLGGGPVSGAADAHCGGTIQKTSAAACHGNGTGGAGGGGGAGGSGEGGAASEYGPTMVGSEGDDDDCKYHVEWSTMGVCEGSSGVTFFVTVKSKADGMPVTGAKPYVEVFLNSKHPAPETGDGDEFVTGEYRIGPVVFDAPGKWTVRFHFFGDCSDSNAESPHAHAAFYVNVP